MESIQLPQNDVPISLEPRRSHPSSQHSACPWDLETVTRLSQTALGRTLSHQPHLGLRRLRSKSQGHGGKKRSWGSNEHIIKSIYIYMYVNIYIYLYNLPRYIYIYDVDTCVTCANTFADSFANPGIVASLSTPNIKWAMDRLAWRTRLAPKSSQVGIVIPISNTPNKGNVYNFITR
jgi:hypothetical protein